MIYQNDITKDHIRFEKQGNCTMKKFLMQTGSHYTTEAYETYEEAEVASKKYVAKNLEDVTIVRREALATVKPDIKAIPVLVERANPA